MSEGGGRESDPSIFAKSIDRQLEHLSGSFTGMMCLTNPSIVTFRGGKFWPLWKNRGVPPEKMGCIFRWSSGPWTQKQVCITPCLLNCPGIQTRDLAKVFESYQLRALSAPMHHPLETANGPHSVHLCIQKGKGSSVWDTCQQRSHSLDDLVWSSGSPFQLATCFLLFLSLRNVRVDRARMLSLSVNI